MTRPGITVALTLAPAHDDDGHACKISGLFVVDEFHPYDPAAYYHAPAWTVVADTGEAFEVDAEVIFEQTDPSAYGRELVQEREMEFAAEHLS